jgi:hypothetical protein
VLPGCSARWAQGMIVFLLPFVIPAPACAGINSGRNPVTGCAPVQARTFVMTGFRLALRLAGMTRGEVAGRGGMAEGCNGSASITCSAVTQVCALPAFDSASSFGDVPKARRNAWLKALCDR